MRQTRSALNVEAAVRKNPAVNHRPQFWQTLTVLGPLGCLALIPTVGRVLGVFDRFEWVGQEVSPLARRPGALRTRSPSDIPTRSAAGNIAAIGWPSRSHASMPARQRMGRVILLLLLPVSLALLLIIRMAF
jgi:hypothetical protein